MFLRGGGEGVAGVVAAFGPQCDVDEADELLAEVTVETEDLAHECQQEEPGSAVKLAVSVVILFFILRVCVCVCVNIRCVCV